MRSPIPTCCPCCCRLPLLCCADPHAVSALAAMGHYTPFLDQPRTYKAYTRTSSGRSDERTISGHTDASDDSTSSSTSRSSWLSQTAKRYLGSKQAKSEGQLDGKQGKVQPASERAKWRAVIRKEVLSVSPPLPLSKAAVRMQAWGHMWERRARAAV